MNRLRRGLELLAVTTVVILVFLACTVVSPGTEEEPSVRASSTPIASVTPAESTPTNTPSPEPALPTPRSTPTPRNTPTPVSDYTPPVRKGSKYADVEGERGVLNEREYFRTAPGRNQPRVYRLEYHTKLFILNQYKSEFNEIWYRVAVVIDGKTEYGFVQASSVDLGKAKPTPARTGPTSIGDGDTSIRHGEDRDGDGVYVVVLDPGHGGLYYGASHFGAIEKNLNLKVAMACKEHLESTYENVLVYLTRDSDRSIDPVSEVDDLERRVRVAVDCEADILVSMHFDADGGKHRGAEGLVPKGALNEKCMALSSLILENLEELGIENLGNYKRRSERSRYSYPDGDHMDGYLINRLAAEKGIVNCIIEHAQMDNEQDFYEFCDTDEKLKKIGIADATGIATYLGLNRKTQ